MEKENKKITINDLAIMIADGFEGMGKRINKVEKKMATKKDLESFKLETNNHFNNMETDLKSFKDDKNKSIEKLEKDVADLEKTELLYDKRIQKLEKEIFPELNVV